MFKKFKRRRRRRRYRRRFLQYAAGTADVGFLPFAQRVAQRETLAQQAVKAAARARRFARLSAPVLFTTGQFIDAARQQNQLNRLQRQVIDITRQAVRRAVGFGGLH